MTMGQDLNVKITIGAALAASHAQAVGSAKKSIKDYVSSIGAAIKQHKLFQGELGKTDRMMKAAERRDAASAKLMNSRRLLVGGAAAYGMSKLIGAAANIEEQGNYLRTVINTTGNKDAAIGKSMQHARDFSRKSLASQSEVLNIEYALNSSGLSEEVSRAGTELVHKLAKVTQGAPAQVGEVFATTLNNLGADMEGTLEQKMNRIGNVLAKVQFKFQIRDFDQLGESMKYAASTMAGMKVDFEQGASAIGQLNSAGLQGSMAGTAFNAMLKNMGKASDQLGFDMVRGADGSLNLIDTLQGLKDSLDGMDIEQRGQLLQDIFADEGKRGIVPLLDQLDQLKSAHKEVAAAAKSNLVNDEYAIFLKSSAASTLMFKQNVALLGQTFAGTLLPAVNAILKPLTAFAGWAAEGIAKYPIIGDLIKGLAVGLVAVKSVALLVTAATWAWNAALAANPITWIIVGVVALGAAIYALAANWETVWGKIKEVGSAMWAFMKEWGKAIVEIFAPAMDFIGGMWEKIQAVGRFIGIGGSKGKGAVAGAAMAATAAVAPLPSLPDLPPAATSGQVVNQNSQSTVNAPITITQQPGQSAEDLAAQIRRELDTRQRQAAAEQRGALYDG